MLFCVLFIVFPSVLSITITPTAPVSSATTFPYSNFYADLSPGPSDETGAILIGHIFKDEPRDLFCDSDWNDYDSNDLCKLWNYKHGRRAFQSLQNTQERLFGTVPICHFWVSLADFLIATYVECELTEKVDEVLGCADDEIAGVYCWNEDFLNKYEYQSHSNSKKKWSVELKMFNVKYGQKYNVVGEDSLIKTPKGKDFKVLSCGREVALKLKVDKKQQSLKIRGKWNRKMCEESCLEFFYQEERIIPETCLKKKKKK